MSLSKEIKNHIKHKLFVETELTNKPFVHTLSDNVFPDEYYQEIMNHMLPDKEYYQEVTDVFNHRLRLWVGHNERINCILNGKSDKKCRLCKTWNGPQIRDPFWKELLEFLVGDEMLDLWINKYEPALIKRHGLEKFNSLRDTNKFNLSGYLNRDGKGYSIGPHLDKLKKSITILIYLPSNEDIKHFGTTLCEPKKSYKMKTRGGHHNFENFDDISMIECIPKRVFSFLVNIDSWHCVHEIDEVVSRNSIQLNIYHV